jgi:O-6-methylguanine DNA methyltransferase
LRDDVARHAHQRRFHVRHLGETRSYLRIATAIGSPVGAANGANPVPIVVPCHRVIGAKGKLVGYGGGLAMKQRLLELEGCTTMSFPSTEPRPIK